jgi:hypothetical protein
MKRGIFCEEKLQQISPPQSNKEELDKGINHTRKYWSVGELKCGLVSRKY